MNNITPGPAAPPLQTTRLAEVEVLRAIAVLMVMVHHLADNLIFWPSHLSSVFIENRGFWTGVDLFFVISGFVIARSLLPRLAKVTDWTGFTQVAASFWIARAWRLLPSSWLWLTAPLLLCLAFNHTGVYGGLLDNWNVLIAGVFDMENFHFAQTIFSAHGGTAFVQWSLSLEEQFYILLPFAAFFFRRCLPLPLLLIALAGFFAPNNFLVLLTRLWPVAFGVLLALWSPHASYQACAPEFLAKSRAARIGGLILLLLCLVSVGSPGLIVIHYQGPVALLSAILVWIASYGRGYLWQEGFPRRVLEIIAARSYSLYLIHIPVYFAAHEAWFRLHGLAAPSRHQAIALCGLSFLVLAGVVELNHRLLEKPLRAHGKRLAAAYRARTMPETLPA